MTEISLKVDDLSSDPDVALEQALSYFDEDTEVFYAEDKFIGPESEYFDIAAEYLVIFEKIIENYDDIDVPESPDIDAFKNIVTAIRIIDRYISDIRNFLEPKKLQKSIEKKGTNIVRHSPELLTRLRMTS